MELIAIKELLLSVWRLEKIMKNLSLNDLNGYFQTELFKNFVPVKYLIDRGFTKDMIINWGLGYCPDYIEGYELLRHRITFPVHNWRGETVYFAGRCLYNNSKLKYAINSNNKILYGLNYAMYEMVRFKQAFIVEGFTDVIACHQMGLINTVGGMGLAVSLPQIELLSRWIDKVILLMDGDKPGRNSIERLTNQLKDSGVKIGSINLPKGKDPFDLYREGYDNSLLLKNIIWRRSI